MNNIEYNKLFLLKKYILSATPLHMFDIKEILGADCIMTDEVQKKVLESTLFHPTAKKYPPKLSYQKAFLKALMVESSGAEVCDELYAALCSTLVGRGPSEDHHYRHYFLADGGAGTTSLVLKESCSIVSGGTTGLCAWQASQALSEWCLAHPAVLAGRRVLELGSGVGLTGLVACLRCRPASYVFSDAHPAVLRLLRENVARNLALVPGPDAAGDATPYAAALGCTAVQVVDLPWESVPSHSALVPEVVLAADVVYDSTLFQPLCEALRHLAVEVNHKCLIVLACTIRNSHTLDQFFSRLATSSLHVQTEEVIQPSVFIYSSDPPVKVYTITSTPRSER
ncbi:protein-lysine N-methyltransferase EEF2KMT isoform X2 [Bacillus rossius redtenbacheri]|uniref:protein-lysine N-methyltransferase EEF2KMT isoform X2 n=1 Tax=Bacillus rossius redtenbacheri TaxID=93214 RepID=UPI002FDE9A39